MARAFDSDHPFPDLARIALADGQLRSNLAHATTTIREKRGRAVGELGDWEDLRDAGVAIKDYVLENLEALVVQLEQSVTRNGGVVHWARTAQEANAIVVDLVQATSAKSVVKIKSMVTQEIGLNAALEEHGIAAYETDLAELIVQLGDDLPSHILVPAIHKNRSQIRDIFIREMGRSGLDAPAGLTDDPAALAAAARAHLRDRFFTAKVGISGANFLIADTGGLVIVESEGNGRMCLTLPETLISVVGVEKILPDWKSLGVFLQLLPRSSTGERMNPYTSIFTGVTPGDGPSRFHLVLLDNGRTSALADPDGREVLRCIRCSACLNVCPVYERTGGHAYGNPYPGPIGAVLVPQLRKTSRSALEESLPYASSLCGACYEVCPVKIDIPRILVKLRTDVVDAKRSEHPRDPELLTMKAAGSMFSSPRRFQRLVSMGAIVARIARRPSVRYLPAPLNKWTSGRDAPLPQTPTFRTWFAETHPLGRESDQAAPVNSAAAASAAAPSERSRVRIENGGEQSRASMISAIGDAIDPGRGSSHRIPAATYRTAGTLSASERISQFEDRLVDYRASVIEAAPGQVGSCVAELLARRGATTLAVPADLPEAWTSGVGAEIRRDDPAMGIDALDATDATLSACAIAISETGTIILDSGPMQGRRILSLIPDHLIVVVAEEQVVQLVPEAVARLDPVTAQTWISGPSATSDIELERIEGVHGPRVLDVVVIRADR